MSKRDGVGTSLVVQWLRLCTSTAENSSSISDGEWLIKIHKIYIYIYIFFFFFFLKKIRIKRGLSYSISHTSCSRVNSWLKLRSFFSIPRACTDRKIRLNWQNGLEGGSWGGCDCWARSECVREGCPVLWMLPGGSICYHLTMGLGRPPEEVRPGQRKNGSGSPKGSPRGQGGI